MAYLEYICPLICFVVCVLHSIVEGVIASKQNKKIDKLCEKCGLPVYDSESHLCMELIKSFDHNQLVLLTEFCKYLRGDKNVASE